MYSDQQDSGVFLTRRLIFVAISLALGAQGCASKSPPSANVGKTAEQVGAKPTEVVPPPSPVIEQQALDRLQAMSEKLAAAGSFTYRSRSTMELPARTGQFLTHFIESEVALQRPNKLFSAMTGDGPNFRFYYDGTAVSALDAEKNLYATTKAPGTIDEMLPFVMEKFGIDFPAADFMFSNPFAVMTQDLTHAIVVGPATVNGVPSEHFAFMNPQANWEIWIETGDKPLPRRVAVTYKTVPNFPRFQVEFLDWNLKPRLDAGQFVFTRPPGAEEIEFGSRAGESSR